MKWGIVLFKPLFQNVITGTYNLIFKKSKIANLNTFSGSYKWQIIQAYFVDWCFHKNV